ncbi:MAG: CRISPR-associated helicase Cas3' [Treponema sp.]|nr:CRISPR-associated helicase Cas3' [Treponema sp.]
MYARYREKDGQFQSLESHLMETGVLSELFGEELGFSDVCKLAGILHDLGKYTDAWQKYLLTSLGGKVQKKMDHSTAGAVYLDEHYKKKVSLIKTAVQAIVMYHHGSGLPDMLSPDGKSEFLERLNKKGTAEFIGNIESNLPESITHIIDECIKSDCFELDGCDVLLNNCKKNCLSSKHLYFNMGLHLRNLSSCLIDADRTDSAAFENDETINLEKYEELPDWTDLLLRLENHLANVKREDELGKIRKYVSDKCSDFGRKEKGIYFCSAFTGAGKTFASLRFALEQAKKYKMKKIFIIAPYTSILDQNADEIRKVLEDGNSRGQIVLECHSNLSLEKKEDLKESEENYSRFEEIWDAPVIITTMVQFLETLFGSGTKKIRRMHHLVESVFVFDEIQTLPIKTTYLFNWGLEYLVNVCGCSAMLCTATQPGLDKIGDETYCLKNAKEVISNLEEHFESLKRVDFIDMTCGGIKTHSATEICGYIQEQMKNVNSFLAVVNTKPQAKELFELVKKSGCAEHLFHLSTNMCPAHRKSVISEIKKKLASGERIVCVSTRLIEAGVDLSFEGALRYLSGLDSIIQTAGRCNRNNELHDGNGNPCHGRVAVFALDGEKLGSLEELKIGQNCMERILRDYPADKKTKICNLVQLNVIESYFKYFYGSLSEELLKYSVDKKDMTVLDMLSDNKKAVLEYRRVHNGEKWNLPYMQSFKTAWENFEVIADTTTGIIVPYKNDIAGRLCALERGEEDYGKKLRKLLHEAQQYTVNVYSNQLEKLFKENMIFEVLPDSDIYALNNGFYDMEKGLSGEFSATPLIF